LEDELRNVRNFGEREILLVNGPSFSRSLG